MVAPTPTWTEDRIALLKSLFDRGRTCREIADEIGVSRNAVIGKLSRLNVSRPSGRGGARSERTVRAKVQRPGGARQLQILLALRVEPQPQAEAEPIHNGQCCSLMELSRETCRWPIDNTGAAADVWYCGNKPVEGLPYCAGHARIAYRLTSRPGRAQ